MIWSWRRIWSFRTVAWTDYRLTSPCPEQRIASLRASAVEPLRLELQPFEVLVFEVAVIDGAEKYDAAAYRQRLAKQRAKREQAVRAVLKDGSVREYQYQGHTYQRHFLPDGKANLYVNGHRLAAWNGFTWRIEGERLIVDKPDGSIETHYLDDQGRLVLPAVLGGTAEKVR